MWGNRLTNAKGNGLSFQPQAESPYYYLYNQIGDCGLGIFKFRVPDRTVYINNTFWGYMGGSFHEYMRCYGRNNLFSYASSPVWASKDESDINPSFVRSAQHDADWNTDIDYDGLDRGGSGNFIRWNDDTTFWSSLSAWTSDVTNTGTTGISAEENGYEVTTAIYDSWASRGPTYSLILVTGSNAAFEAGISVDNLADWHGTPDGGAFQRGAAVHQFGPRAADTELVDQTENWIKH